MPDKETRATRARYQRVAPVYDLMEALPERRFTSWRRRLWSLVKGPRVLEVGVGTGRNMLYYPQGVHITAIDLTPGMLWRARLRARELGLDASLCLGDVQEIMFADESFDTVVATCVFCSVAHPLQGLQEVLRVLKPGGQALFIEHVRSEEPLLGALMDLVDPLVVRMMGPHISRRTIQNIRQSRLMIEEVDDLGMRDIFKLVIARKQEQ